MPCIEFDEISVLIPGYSPEDLPADLEEDPAASLLNACLIAWHPRLLARSRGIPKFRQAESLNHFSGRHVFVVPAPAVDWMPHQWRDEASTSTSLAIGSFTDRAEWLSGLAEALRGAGFDDGPAETSVCCVDDFLALGLAHLLVVVLSRRMHHFIDPDETTLDREVHLAAEAALSGDEQRTREHLQRCFDSLRETREQFYPLDCFLIDLCVPPAGGDPTVLREVIESTPGLNVVGSARELQRWCVSDPKMAEAISSAHRAGTLSLVSGGWNEQRPAPGTLGATLHDLVRGQSASHAAVQFSTPCWGRKRFGLTANLPAVLRHCGFQFALHTALDDGTYPEYEHSWFEWEGTDGTRIHSGSRIPLAIDSAASVLKLPDRLRESMQDDASAVVILARLPVLRSPWPEDLRRIVNWSPVPGQFTTLDSLCSRDAVRGTQHAFKASEYLSPHLIQSSVLKSERPVSDPARLYRLWLRSEAAAFQAAMVVIARPPVARPSLTEQINALRDQLNDLEGDRLLAESDVDGEAFDTALAVAETQIASLTDDLADEFRRTIPAETRGVNGMLVQNPLPMSRTVAVDWPQCWRAPAECPEIVGWQSSPSPAAFIRLPPGGFVWLTEHDDRQRAMTAFQPKRREPPLAEESALRNRHFEIRLSESSGGIESIMFHGRREILLSQRPCLRYERRVTLHSPDDAEPRWTHYAVATRVSSRVVRAEPLRGAVETVFELRSPADDAVVCRGRQIVEVNRFEPRIELTIHLDEIAQPVRGNPWLSYLGSRFATGLPGVTVSRSVLHQSADATSERFETPDYVELANDAHRVVIATHGAPWHRSSGDGMVDSVLIVEGESSTSFRFTIDIDPPASIDPVLQSVVPPVIHRTEGLAPSRMPAAWLLGLSSPAVMIVRTELSIPPTPDETASGNEPRVVRLTLVETEGRDCHCVVRTARTPSAAFCRTVTPETHSLEVTENGVTVPMRPFGISEIELQF